ERGAPKGTIYSAQPIGVGRPIWRVDLLESVAGRPGSFDRTHHHPVFRGWDPTSRVFDAELTADPFGWLEKRLADLDGVLAAAGRGPGDRPLAARAGLRAGHRGVLGRAPDPADLGAPRTGAGRVAGGAVRAAGVRGQRDDPALPGQGAARSVADRAADRAQP